MVARRCADAHRGCRDALVRLATGDHRAGGGHSVGAGSEIRAASPGGHVRPRSRAQRCLLRQRHRTRHRPRNTPCLRCWPRVVPAYQAIGQAARRFVRARRNDRGVPVSFWRGLQLADRRCSRWCRCRSWTRCGTHGRSVDRLRVSHISIPGANCGVHRSARPDAVGGCRNEALVLGTRHPDRTAGTGETRVTSRWPAVHRHL